jgi:hypothetical protein
MIFQKLKGRKTKQVLSRSGYQQEVGEQKLRIEEGEYGGCTLYLFMKTEQ